MRDGSYDVCPQCYRKHIYRKHMNMHTCSGCGESKPVTAKCDQKEPWMRKGAQMLGDPCPRNVKKLRLIHRGIGVTKRFAVKARDALYRRPAASVPSRKKPAAAAFCSKRQVAACSGKVTREYKSCDTVQCDDIGELFEASWGAGDNVVDVKEQVQELQLSCNSFTAHVMTLGDPCPGKVKKLRLIHKGLSRQSPSRS